MYDDVLIKLKNKNKILFSKDSPSLKKLVDLLEKQTHKILILWAFECAKEPLRILNQKYPNEQRFNQAYDLCQLWAKGEVKMPEAKRAILACHAVAKEIKDPHDIALCHALGQGLSTIHVKAHAIGLVVYELSALVHKFKPDYISEVDHQIDKYMDTLLYIQKNIDVNDLKWAQFLDK